LEEQLEAGKKVTEISGATRLEEFRREQESFVGLSFPTISSAGPNGAIIHYRPEADSDREITKEEIYLCDSGAQYRDGTTDVTRTLSFGTPSAFQKECYTRVLKGQLGLCRAIFPNKTKGNVLDVIARQHLWNVGLNYLHGTGHGIGSFLNVHEGPMGISFKPFPHDPGLQQNMFLSDEPGYYEDEKFGIRLEDIVQVIPAKTPYNHQNRGYLTFKSITPVPYQRKLIEPNLLTDIEIKQLNARHAESLEKVGSLLKQQKNDKAWAWLKRECEPLG